MGDALAASAHPLYAAIHVNIQRSLAHSMVGHIVSASCGIDMKSRMVLMHSCRADTRNLGRSAEAEAAAVSQAAPPTSKASDEEGDGHPTRAAHPRPGGAHAAPNRRALAHAVAADNVADTVGDARPGSYAAFASSSLRSADGVLATVAVTAAFRCALTMSAASGLCHAAARRCAS